MQKLPFAVPFQREAPTNPYPLITNHFHPFVSWCPLVRPPLSPSSVSPLSHKSESDRGRNSKRYPRNAPVALRKASALRRRRRMSKRFASRLTS